jgi:hypothetical protein
MRYKRESGGAARAMYFVLAEKRWNFDRTAEPFDGVDSGQSS